MAQAEEAPQAIGMGDTVRVRRGRAVADVDHYRMVPDDREWTVVAVSYSRRLATVAVLGIGGYHPVLDLVPLDSLSLVRRYDAPPEAGQ